MILARMLRELGLMFTPPHRPFPKIERDPNRAFAKDWEKLGGDMRRAVETVKPKVQ